MLFFWMPRLLLITRLLGIFWTFTLQEYSFASQLWRLSSTDICEIGWWTWSCQLSSYMLFDVCIMSCISVHLPHQLETVSCSQALTTWQNLTGSGHSILRRAKKEIVSDFLCHYVVTIQVPGKRMFQTSEWHSEKPPCNMNDDLLKVREWGFNECSSATFLDWIRRLRCRNCCAPQTNSGCPPDSSKRISFGVEVSVLNFSVVKSRWTAFV